MAKQRQSRPKAKLREEDDRSGMRIARQVVIVAVPPVRAVDVFGPAEVFGDANWLRRGDPSYKVSIVSACRERLVPSYIETPLHTDQTFREFRGPIDAQSFRGFCNFWRWFDMGAR
jgi:hypothetical protein